MLKTNEPFASKSSIPGIYAEDNVTGYGQVVK
ncbi:unnamed protein product [Linum tenue]|uniref:Uncharacterized protein n=1 Tax=Linum tenue TaxID=586396 RepID=A0AAV0KN03_9ROSI|nr:unnamed protein product [Linum tenue]